MIEEMIFKKPTEYQSLRPGVLHQIYSVTVE